MKQIVKKILYNISNYCNSHKHSIDFKIIMHCFLLEVYNKKTILVIQSNKTIIIVIMETLKKTISSSNQIQYGV